MYVRVKRNKTTYFVQCDPTETTLDIKQKLQNLIDQPSNNQRLTLVATNDVLDDSKTLAEQKNSVENLKFHAANVYLDARLSINAKAWVWWSLVPQHNKAWRKPKWTFPQLAIYQ
ncbi:uncharacterized protein [Elaeis guineensis]